MKLRRKILRLVALTVCPLFLVACAPASMDSTLPSEEITPIPSTVPPSAAQETQTPTTSAPASTATREPYVDPLAGMNAADFEWGTWEERILTLRDPNGRLMVSAHRGYWNGPEKLPENSIAAIRGAYELGADIVEIDVRKTKDGVFVLSHDDKLDRITNIWAAWDEGLITDTRYPTSYIANLTYADIAKLRLKKGEGGDTAELTDEIIATLEEAIDYAKGRIILLLDMGWKDRAEICEIIAAKDAFDVCMFQGSGSLAELDDAMTEIYELYGRVPLFNWFCNGKTPAAVTESFRNQITPEHGPAICQPNPAGITWASVGGDYSFDDALDQEMMAVVGGEFRCMFGTYLDWGRILHFPLDSRPYWEQLYEAGYNVIQTDSPDIVIEYIKELMGIES